MRSIPREIRQLLLLLSLLGLGLDATSSAIAQEPALRATLKGHSDVVTAVAFSPDGKSLMSASEDKTVKLWDVATVKVTTSLTNYRTYCAAFSPDGKTVAAGGQFMSIKLWDVTGKKKTVTLDGHTGQVTAVTFSPDGKTLASSSEDKTIKLWDVASGKHIATLEGHAFSVLSVAFGDDGKVLASGGGGVNAKAKIAGGEVKLWDLATRKNVANIPGHISVVYAVAFAPQGKVLATGSRRGDPRTKEYWGEIRLWDVVNAKNMGMLKSTPAKKPLTGIESLAFSPDGKTIAAGSIDTTINVWDVESGQLIATLKGHTDGVTSVTISPDGKVLASASWDRTIRLWDMPAVKQADK